MADLRVNPAARAPTCLKDHAALDTGPEVAIVCIGAIVDKLKLPLDVQGTPPRVGS